MTKALYILVSSLVLVTPGCDPGPKSYLDKGDRAFASSQSEEAILNYRKAIQKDPKLGEAYYKLGLAYLPNNQPREAYQALSTAVELMPNRDDATTQFAELCLKSYLADSARPKRLYEQIQLASARLLARNPDSVEGLRFKGYLALIDRRVPEAIEIFLRANALAPMRPDVVLPLTQALLEDHQNEEGERLALDLIGRDKTFGPIYSVLYLQYVGANRMADAEHILKLKVENNPKEAAYVFELARHYAAIKNQAELSRTLRRLLDHPKEFPQAYIQAGEFYMNAGNAEAAQAIFEEGLKLDPKTLDYRKRIANALVAQGKRAEAERAVDAILSQDPKDFDGRRLRALLLLEEGTPEKIERANTELQRLTLENPDDPIRRFDLGRAHLAKGNLDAAHSDFQEALRRGGDPVMARLFLAEISLTKHQPAEALRYADEIVAVQPLNPRARLLRATSLMGLQLYGQARFELESLLKADPRYREARLQLGFLDVVEKRFQEAEAAFRDLYRPGQGESPALRGLVEIRIARGQFEDALRLLSQELNAPNSSSIRQLLAGVASRAGKYDVAVEQYQQLLAANPASAGLYQSLAEVQRRKGDAGAAILSMQRALELDPSNANAHVFLADTYQEAANQAKAKEEYEKALRLDPENPVASNNLAFILAEGGGNIDQALTLARLAIRKNPGQPTFSDTLGIVYLKKNMNAAALQTFKSLTKAHPGNPTFHYHLAMTLLKMGDKSRARVELQTALSMKPDTNRQLIKELLARIG